MSNEQEDMCLCDNCGWRGKDPLPFASSWSEWINCQDVNQPVILPVGECPNEDCGCTVYLEEASKAMTLAQRAQQLLESLKDVIACEYDRDEESRNFDQERLDDYQSVIALAEGKTGT